jgi:ribosomal protein S18 acetylase RimI-like enzyme
MFFSLKKVQFRLLTPEDKPALIDFYCKCHGDERREKLENTMTIKDDRNRLSCIAVYKGEIVGTAGLRRITLKDGDIWYVTELMVLPSSRGFGIGEKLGRTLISNIPDESFTVALFVLRKSVMAINLYKKLGLRFVEEGEKEKFKEKFKEGNNICRNLYYKMTTEHKFSFMILETCKDKRLNKFL